MLLAARARAAMVSGLPPRALTLETLLPDAGERFPWAGHLGLVQLSRVIDRLLSQRTSLLFTNTRSQAELWHRALSAVWPEDQGTLALHHGSLDPKLRSAAEQGLRAGTVRCVVATSSLDLGVDFPRSTRCCSSAARKAWRACCNAQAARGIVRASRRTSCACRRTRWS